MAFVAWLSFGAIALLPSGNSESELQIESRAGPENGEKAPEPAEVEADLVTGWASGV